MAATLELRRYNPNNFDSNNPDPEFKEDDFSGSLTQWTVNSGTYNADFEKSNISGTSPKVTTNFSYSGVNGTIVVGRVNEDTGSGTAECTVYDSGGAAIGVSRLVTSSDSTDNGYFVASFDLSSEDTSGSLGFEVTSNSSNDNHIYAVYLLEQDTTIEQCFDTSNSHSFVASNANFMRDFSDDSNNTIYNSASGKIPPTSTSYNITLLPTFTGTFAAIRTMKVWMNYDPDSDSTDNFSNNTNNTNLYFIEENNSNSIHCGTYTVHNPKAMDVDSFDSTGSTSQIIYSQSSSISGSDSQINGPISTKLIKSTAGDSTTGMDSNNKHTLSDGSTSSTDNSTWLNEFDSFPSNTFNPFSFQVQTKSNINTTDFKIQLHTSWEESS